MKTFSVAIAVAIVLTAICVQESSAVRGAAVDDWKKPIEPEDVPVTIEEEIPVDSWQMPYQTRQERRRCRFCCGCCPRMRGCGVCCRF